MIKTFRSKSDASDISGPNIKLLRLMRSLMVTTEEKLGSEVEGGGGEVLR